MANEALKYAEGVSPAPESDDDEALIKALKTGKAKVRITTMIDEDVYRALRERAAVESDGRYQTFLNLILRKYLINGTGLSLEAMGAIVDGLAKKMKLVEKRLAETEAKSAARSAKPKAGQGRPARRIRDAVAAKRGDR